MRLFAGIVGICGLLFISVLVRSLINEPSTLILLMTIVYSTLTFLFIALGLFSIKTFKIDDNVLIESFLWGLIKRKNSLLEIENFKSQMTSNKFGTFEELIINKKTGETIFIQEFDQKEYKEFKNKLKQLLIEDNTIEPNYWTNFYKIVCVFLVIWYALMIGLRLLS
ncbi:MAG: hypothetical protein HXX18_14590 [Bacteroidetes bacterium]|nr:hypothetical protein [Bacteroidota bacterium]